MRRVLVAFILVATPLLNLTSAQADDGAGAYELSFDCPDAVDPEKRRVRPVLRCPMDVVDELDVMSQPVLLVDPADNRYMAFNALHGGHGTDEVPSNWSRNNHIHQPHTTFYSIDEDHAVWNDNPYYSPLAPESKGDVGELPVLRSVQALGRKVTGEDNAATLDGHGRVYLASLYAYKEANEGAYDYAIGFWKSQRVNRPVDYNTGNVLWKAPDTVLLDSIHMVHVPAVDRVVALWREVNVTSPAKSYVNMAWTTPGQGAFWTFLPEAERLGPCDAITNPIVSQARIFVGCFAGEGYPAERATTTALQIQSFDGANGWRASHVEQAPIYRQTSNTNALLVDRTEGRMLIVAAGVGTDTTPFLKVSYGLNGSHWDPADSYSSRLSLVSRPADATIVDARATAAVFRPDSGNLHIVYKERYQFQADVQRPGAAEISKSFISIHTGAERQFNRLLPLGVDVSEEVERGRPGACQIYDVQTQGIGHDVFDDRHDGLVIWRDPRSQDLREYLLYGDCGNARFAEVNEVNFAPFGFPAPPGTPPVPTALSAANPSLTGAVAGALAGAMVLRMLAFKRKLAVEAPA